MKYHDTVTQAQQKMTLAVAKLTEWKLATSPINYAVSYEYIDGRNSALIKAIEQELSIKKTLDGFFVEQAYQQYILGQSAFRDEIIGDMDDVLANMEKGCQYSSNSVNQFIRKLDNNFVNLKSTDKPTVELAVNNIKHASTELKTQQQALLKQLAMSQQQANSLRNELEEVRKEIFLDPLTGLYNRKAMAKHLDAWLTEDPNKEIAAIVINVDEFSQFSQKFGPLLGNVLLSKIAQKVSSYVDDSGLPVRTGGEEFLILLPEVETSVASEIAEKIRQGVEKLRFVSSKSGMRLPKMTVSLAVNRFNAQQGINHLITKARRLLNQPDDQGNNQVISAR